MLKRLSPEETKYYRKLDEKDLECGVRKAIGFTVTPGDGFEQVEYYGEAFIDPTEGLRKPQLVYVLVNPSMQGLCKIGFTRHTLYERVRQLNASSGVITPWYPVFSYKCPDGRMLESEVHRYLEDMGTRVNSKREGFEISSTDAIRIIEELGKKYQNQSI